jgi:hypothetical protein
MLTFPSISFKHQQEPNQSVMQIIILAMSLLDYNQMRKIFLRHKIAKDSKTSAITFYESLLLKSGFEEEIYR